jgi:hypothetical protein
MCTHLPCQSLSLQQASRTTESPTPSNCAVVAGQWMRHLLSWVVASEVACHHRCPLEGPVAEQRGFWAAAAAVVAAAIKRLSAERCVLMRAAAADA